MSDIHDSYDSDKDIDETGGKFGMVLANRLFAKSKKNRNIRMSLKSDLDINRYKTDFDKDEAFLEGARGMDPNNITSDTLQKTILLRRVKGQEYLRVKESEEGIPIENCTPEQIGRAFQEMYHTIEENLSR
jgi:hypothetical protein